jgi:hypothetical protein
VQSFVGKFKDEFVAKGTADEERRANERFSAEIEKDRNSATLKL